MPAARVHCLCADSGAGKSTALAAFARLATAERGQSVGGVLGPLGKADGLRKLASASVTAHLNPHRSPNSSASRV